MSNRRKVLKGLSSQTVITVVLGIVEIVAFSIMSRLLSQKDFGYYAAIVAVSTVFQSLADTGIGAAIVHKKNINKQYINNAFTLCLIVGVIVSGTLFLLSPILASFVADDTMSTPLRIYSVTILCQCISSVYISLLQRKLQFIKIGIVNLSAFVSTTIVAIILAIHGFGYYAILVKAVLSAFMVLILSLLLTRPHIRLQFDWHVIKGIFDYGGWLMLSAVFRNFSNQLDRLLMARLFSIETLGLYTRPKEFIAKIIQKINSIFDSVLFPVLSNIQDEMKRMCISFQNAIYYLNIMSVLLCMAFIFGNELIIRIFFGEQWIGIKYLFIALSFWCILNVNGRMGDVFLRSLGETRRQFFLRVAQLLSMFVCIIISYRWGVMAMAIAAMAGYALIAAYKVWYVSKSITFPLKTVLATYLKSYRIVVVLIPLFIVSEFFIPHTLPARLSSHR